MYITRSASSSELTYTDINQKSVAMEIKQNIEDGAENESLLSSSEKDAILSSKAQTLDRFARLSSISHQGEKRKKNLFASFRLSKKSTSKRKEDENVDFNASSKGAVNNPEDLQEKEENGSSTDEINSNLLSAKYRKRYLNRMSSFVSRVANKVQISNDLNYGFKSKLERSQTVTGTDLSPEKVDYVTFENEIPALMGIRNHGNTCFMNAVIQCLSHTDILAEYFVLDQYKSDLARCNRINSKKYGTKGEITEHLATLLKSLWVLRYVPDISLNLKNIIEKYEPCYRGSNQHDAAEFLMFILDKVHEDLNTASKRKYKKIKNSYGRPDEQVAAETLANHQRCNSSFVQDIFQAQFRSSLKCPHCLKESNTFDPYLCVSIPIPQYAVLSIHITVVYLNQQPKQVKIGVRIEASATFKQLRHVISTDCGICPEHIIITEIDGEGFHRTFEDNSCVNIIKANDPIYAIEMTPPSLQENGAFIHVIWVNVLRADPDNIRFGGVYQSQVARDVTYEDFQKLLLKEMTTIVSSDTLTSEQQRGIFRIALHNGSKTEVTLDADLDLPLLHQSVEDSLSISHPMAGPLHIKFVLQWDQENKEKYIVDDVDHVDEHSSIGDVNNKAQEYAPVSLSDCLQLHTSAETLSCGDAWHCPTCNRKQQVLKRLTLWSSPQILVIHLKRFRQASLGINSSKLNTVVNFPLTGFDISDHMAGRGGTQSESTKVLSGVWSSWKRNKKMNFSENDFVYDLFAVCNHHGRDLQGGHYTAACRNPTSGRWNLFDDFNIVEVTQESVVDQDAYILFYQRREEDSPSSYEPKNHWSFRIPNTSLPPILKVIPNTKDIKKDILDDDAIVASSKEDILEKEELGEDKVNKTTSTPEPNGEEAAPISSDCPAALEKQSLQSPVKETSISAKNDKQKKELIVDIENTSDFEASDKESSSPDIIPEVRIQPASLQVLASHRMASRPSSTAEGTSTCSTSSRDSSSDRSKESPSGDETTDETTPEVRISHRQSKSASYVVIKTPSPKAPNKVLSTTSTRNSRLFQRSRESLHDDRTNGESGYGSHEDSEVKSITTTTKGTQNPDKSPQLAMKPSNGPYLTKRSSDKRNSKTLLTAMDKNRERCASKMVKKPNPDPCKSGDSYNHYLTESSV